MNRMDMLNDRQKEAAMATEGPVLILAGAGSGKTRVLTHRIAYLIEECGVNPWNIMAITFTNKAAGEMRERVNDMVGFGAESIWVSTFHSSCVRILRRYAERIGYDNSFTIYDTDDSKSVMKDICKRLQIDTKQLKERTILGAISSAKNEGILADEYEMAAMGDFNRMRIAKAYKEYQKVLKSNNAMDFDDLLVNAVELLRSSQEVLESYQNRFRYIMVDEYQDTNSIQFEFIRLLASANHNLCVVGDDDQSIYKFRGANIRNILDFEKVFPEAKVVKLEQNYRSTQNVLDAANAVISHNKGRKEKALWTDKGGGNRLHFRQFDYALEEAEYIAYDVAGKKREGICDYKDCAVLYRTNAQARVLEEQFVHAGIPYNIVGGVNFYGRKEIKDLLAYLKTIDNGLDDLAVKRIINIPKRGIGNTTIARVQDYADGKGIGFYEALEEADNIVGIGRSAAKLQPFVTMIQVFRAKAKTYSLKELLEDIIETTGYVNQLEADTDEEVDARKENIGELISKAAAFEEEHEEATLSEFLAEVALVADIDNVDSDRNKVLLMTLHSAKGLEFPHVYLAGMEDGVFPSYMSIMASDFKEGDSEEIEEERRLAYVGITRAKEDLTLTAAKARMVRGETQYNPVSRFIREIPAELLDNKVPSGKAKGYVEYEDDSYERNIFKKKPYDMVSAYSGRNSYGQSRGQGYEGAQEYGNRGRAGSDLSDDVFDKSRPVQTSRGAETVGSAGGYRAVTKPKAVVKPKETKAEVKPFIAKGTAMFGAKGITKGVQAPGEKPDYDIGDRVSHIKFGEGTVKNLEKGAKDYQVTVEFDQYGQKILFAAFAKLQKL